MEKLSRRIMAQPARLVYGRGSVGPPLTHSLDGPQYLALTVDSEVMRLEFPTRTLLHRAFERIGTT